MQAKDGIEWRKSSLLPFYMEVSNDGQVRSIDHVSISKRGVSKRHKGRLLKKVLNDSGYFLVGFRSGTKCRVERVHRAVADAFLPNPNNLPFINHKNAIKTDNRIENLEWCTLAYNNRHAFCYGGHADQNGEKGSNARLRAIDIINIRSRVNEKQQSIADEFGISNQHVSDIINGKKWKSLLNDK